MRRILLTGQPRNNRINEVDVYFYIGDSNANGALEEPVGMDAKYLTPNEKVLIYYKPDRDATDNGEWQKYSLRATATEDVNRWPGNTHAGTYYFGPDQSFTYRLGEQTTRRVALIKVARGGSSTQARTGTDNDWAKGNAADANEGGAEMHSVFFFYFLTRALRDLRKVNKYGIQHGRVKFKGIIVRLGTNDCITGVWTNAATFRSAVSSLIAQIHRKTKTTLPIYWVQVRDDLELASGGTYAQANVDACRAELVAAKPLGSAPIAQFNLIESYESDGLQSDGVHFDMAAYESQGITEANLLLPL